MEQTFDSGSCVYGTIANYNPNDQSSYSPLHNTSINRLAAPSNFSTPNMYHFATQYYIATTPNTSANNTQITAGSINGTSPQMTYMDAQQNAYTTNYQIYPNAYAYTTTATPGYHPTTVLQANIQSPLQTYFNPNESINATDFNNTSQYYCDTQHEFYDNICQNSPITSAFQIEPLTQQQIQYNTSSPPSPPPPPQQQQQQHQQPLLPPQQHQPLKQFNYQRNTRKRNSNYKKSTNFKSQNFNATRNSNEENANPNSNFPMSPQNIQTPIQYQPQYYANNISPLQHSYQSADENNNEYAEQYENNNGDGDDNNNENLVCQVCRGRRMCFCYFLKVRYYKFPSYYDLVDYHYKKWRSNATKQKGF